MLALKAKMVRLGSLKEKREECENCFGNWTVLLCWTDLELCIRDGWLIADLQWGQLHPESLFLSLDLWYIDLVHQKTKRREWKLFWKLDCLIALNRSWIVYKRWVTDSWPVMESASPVKSLPYSWSETLRPGLPKKKKKKRKECENCFGNWTVLLCWVDFDLCTRDGWLTAEPQWSQLHP